MTCDNTELSRNSLHSQKGQKPATNTVLFRNLQSSPLLPPRQIAQNATKTVESQSSYLESHSCLGPNKHSIFSCS